MARRKSKGVAVLAHEAAESWARGHLGEDLGDVGSPRRDLFDAWRASVEEDFLSTLYVHLHNGGLVAHSAIHGRRFEPHKPGHCPTDAEWLLSPVQQEEAQKLISRRAPDKRLKVTAAVRPSEVPAFLRELPSSAPIFWRVGCAGSFSEGDSNAERCINAIETTITRQVKGQFFPREAAHCIAEAQGFDSRRFLNEMKEAFRARALTVCDPKTELPREPSEPWRHGEDIVKVDDLNSWLTERGVSYRFPNSSSATIPGAPQVESAAEDIAPPPDSTSSATTTHRLRTRRDALAPLIDRLLRIGSNPPDYASIWNSFVHLADSADPPAPLMEYVEGDVKYRGVDGPTFIGKDAFIKRLKRRTANLGSRAGGG